MAKKQSFNAIMFTVEGQGHFPVDMLRYDRAVAYGQVDVNLMLGSQRESRRVNLIAYSPAGDRLEPTTGRWESFGWRVVAGSVKPVYA